MIEKKEQTKTITKFSTSCKEYVAVLKFYGFDFDAIDVVEKDNGNKIVFFIFKERAKEARELVDKYEMGKLVVCPKMFAAHIGFVLDIIMAKRREQI